MNHTFPGSGLPPPMIIFFSIYADGSRKWQFGERSSPISNRSRLEPILSHLSFRRHEWSRRETHIPGERKVEVKGQ